MNPLDLVLIAGQMEEYHVVEDFLKVLLFLVGVVLGEGEHAGESRVGVSDALLAEGRDECQT